MIGYSEALLAQGGTIQLFSHLLLLVGGVLLAVSVVRRFSRLEAGLAATLICGFGIFHVVQGHWFVAVLSLPLAFAALVISCMSWTARLLKPYEARSVEAAIRDLEKN